MKVLTVVGARPQFIKAAMVTRELAGRGDVNHILVHTGQHYDDNMSSIFFCELDIPQPTYNLAIGSFGHGAQTGRMLEALESTYLVERPDCVLVYGDTNSTLAGALAAAKLQIPVVHIEAGLRSFNRRMPEEINRVLTDHIADLLLAPTQVAVHNLHCEGLAGDRVHLVGDVMYDATIFFAERAESTSTLLTVHGLEPKRYVLATIHREENTDNLPRLASIFEALCRVSEDVPVALPLHPRTRSALQRGGLLDRPYGGILLLEPLGYMDMLVAERNAALIVTDSGGVQKEAFFHRVPCVTIRDETEWVELVESGWNTLVSLSDTEEVVRTIRHGLSARPGIEISPYGNGSAASDIVRLTIEAFA